MIADEFLAAVQRIRQQAPEDVIGQLERPAGKRPDADWKQCSDWYNSLEDDHKRMVKLIALRGCDHALMYLITLIDGTGSMSVDGEEVYVELYLRHGNQKVLLNPPDTEPLHDKIDWSI